MSIIKQAAVVGGGVIGAGWVARLIENGIDVAVYDPAPDAQQKIEAVLLNSRHAYRKLTMAPRAKEGSLAYAASLADAVSQASLIIESVPERLDIKQSVYADIEKFAANDAIIASSTSGIMPTDLQADMQHPERLLVAHPFNPVYLLPLVEIVAGEKTSADIVTQASAIYQAMGMHPLVVKKEIEAFIADRLLEAVWRESLWLVKDGIATTKDIDDAIRYGFGLRWAQMGLFETYRIAGGEAGMRHFMEQFGPCLSWPWTKLMDVPEFNDELVDLIAGQSDEQSGHCSIRELERHRDDNLVAILQALKAKDWGAGKVLGDYEKQCYDKAAMSETQALEQDYSQPIRTFEMVIPTEWTDYNNHMNESRYLECFSQATDAFLRVIGVDADYVAAGNSYFTVETHIRHLDEVTALESVYTTTQVLAADGKKLKLFNSLYHSDGHLLAIGEHMLLHVSLETRRSSNPETAVAEKLAEISALQSALARPEGAGNAIQ
ncbi:carnitine 3-dehydrogenase [Leucothrix pacifica]|uniref:L-carnitine dehydrogenase n=1 Tax=Leucothrix pacifica TaxID=1247513 RepID=A0A317CMT7_9GAMM|nr:carnitine 3-dehydrogenase [Leucothrix pacifica]PWQ99824.1 carnitine 3-dehydrogenase [Leucothrix pacifica]